MRVVFNLEKRACSYGVTARKFLMGMGIELELLCLTSLKNVSFQVLEDRYLQHQKKNGPMEISGSVLGQIDTQILIIVNYFNGDWMLIMI